MFALCLWHSWIETVGPSPLVIVPTTSKSIYEYHMCFVAVLDVRMADLVAGVSGHLGQPAPSYQMAASYSQAAAVSGYPPPPSQTGYTYSDKV